MSKFKFELKQKTVIVASGEGGEIIGRWESCTSEPRYLLRYKDATGAAKETWWDEDALTAAE